MSTARELIAVKGATGMYDTVIPGVVEQAKNIFLRTNPSLAKDLNEVAAKLHADYAPRNAELRDQVVKIYASHFTEQELKEALAFYKTAVGRKLIEHEPKILEKSMGDVQAWANKLSEEIVSQDARRDEEEGPQHLTVAVARRGGEMPDQEVDLFVIGAGSGGVRAARIAAGYGAKVMIAEEYRVGGTCVIRGCVPKKLLVYASRFADEFEDAAGYGWTVPEPSFDWKTLIANKDREIARLELAYTTNLERSKVEIVKSRAVIEDAHTVRLLANGATVRAKHILVATGGAPQLGAEIAGLEHVISSNEAFHLDELPKRILIQGGGYIAVEFACIFNGLGSEVTLVYRGDNILRGFDDDVREHLRGEMERRGDQDHHPADGRGGREGRSRILRRTDRSRILRGRQGHVRDRPPSERRPGWGWSGPVSRCPRPARSRSTNIPKPRCRTSMRWATSPTGSISRRSRSAKAMRSPIRCSAAGRRASIMPTCRRRCSPSRNWASSD